LITYQRPRAAKPAESPHVQGFMPSTAIRYIHYDEAAHELRVGFVDGDDYAYEQVEPETYAAFRQARSKGGFFARKVRGRYPFRRLSHHRP
jgi:hypothetical protein